MSNRVPLTLRDYFFQDDHFKDFWADFDKIREDMMKESQDFWSKNALTPLPEPSSTGALSPMVMPAKRWMLPRMLSRDDSNKTFPADFFNYSKLQEDQIMRTKDNDKSYEVSLDVHQYRPDELKVNVEGKELTVEAKHEEKGEGNFVSRQFKRTVTLPEGCDAKTVTSNLSSDGVLMVTAPKSAKAIENK